MRLDDPTAGFVVTPSSRPLRRILSRGSTHVLSSFAILGLDLGTGALLMFPILFTVPVGFAAWFCGPRLAYALSLVLPVGRFLIDALIERSSPLPCIVSNGLIQVAVLSLITFLALRGREAAALRERVRELEGILPICSFCKDIRDDRGVWTRMESYISHRSEAQFSHDVCPKCAREHYGECMKSLREL